MDKPERPVCPPRGFLVDTEEPAPGNQQNRHGLVEESRQLLAAQYSRTQKSPHRAHHKPMRASVPPPLGTGEVMPSLAC